MTDNAHSFTKYLLQKENKKWLFAALIIGVGYFIALRYLYPVGSFYSDSFTWVGAATTNQPVTFRPVGYSKVIQFFRLLSVSDIALIAGQYFSNLAVNIFLFFTTTFFFPLKKGFRLLLYVLLVTNPFYLFYSNYVSSDAFFNCFTVLWFTLLIWIMYRPTWLLIISQLVLLGALFELRYNAVFFPAVSALSLLLSKMPAIKKAAWIVCSVLLVSTIVFVTTEKTEKYTGTKTFSAFSGWQLANDALHVLQHDTIDTSGIDDTEVKAFTGFTMHFFDTTRQTFPDSGATAVFMWHINSPLKRYMQVFPRRSRSYFQTWNRLGPVYNNFGKTVILQKPVTYIRHFVLPNIKAYFAPPLEIYETYMEDRDTIAAVATKYYHYKTSKTPLQHKTLYALVFNPMQYLFIATNVVFILCAGWYLVKSLYKRQPVLYNHTLLCFTTFYLANFSFIVLLAPSVFRYHIFILTLSFPILLYLLQQLMVHSQKQNAEALPLP